MEASRLPNLEIVKSFYLLDYRRDRQGIREDAGWPNWLSWPIAANEVPDYSQRQEWDRSVLNRRFRFQQLRRLLPSSTAAVSTPN